MAALPNTGERLCGFSLLEKGTIGMLDAETADFVHCASGARLLFIHNDDRELGFNLIYRTPQLDGTDANHMLEHLVLCSCPDYPSRDIFFDMDSKSYATFMNGLTDNTYTCYPICSQSEEQLIRLADVFLCCMERPDALKNRNFFLREGIRLEPGEDGSLSLQGTVLNEDWAHLTDIQECADRCVAEALFPGQNASFLPGQAHLHYRELSFEHVKQRFEQFYHYSNCLIVLYGDMNLERMLRFLDEKHLRHFPSPEPENPQAAARGAGQAALSLLQEPPVPGFRRLRTECPAYEGTPAEHEALIDYAIDLHGCSQEELVYWDLLAGMLDNDTSIWHRLVREAGINHVTEVYLDTSMAKPALRFHLRNGDEELKELFLHCARKALAHVARFGIEPAIREASLKENRLSDWLTREAPHLGFHISEEIARYWSQTGRTDSFSLYERAVNIFSRDHRQHILRRLAQAALSPAASALTATLPLPGLAEQTERERNRYLEELRQSLTPQEQERLRSELLSFQEWSRTERSCMKFLIRPEELPEPEPEPVFSWRRKDALTLYRSPAPGGQMGCYQMFFDISAIPPEDWNYVALYQMLLTELDTGRFTVAEQKHREQEYLHDCTFDECYPDAGPCRFPMMSVTWYALTEDFETGLDFLLDIMGGADYGDHETILRVVRKYMPDYDLSHADSAPSLSYSLMERCIRQDSRFRYLLNSPGLFGFFQNISRTLAEGDREERLAITSRLQAVSRIILSSPRTSFLSAAAQPALDEIEAAAERLLGAARKTALASAPQTARAASQTLPLPPSLPPVPRRCAACIDSPSQELRMAGDFRGVPEFRGRFLPFLLAAADKYIKPLVRYQGGAYDSGIDALLPAGYFTLWSTADPETASTFRIFRETGKALARLALTPDDLNGYILSAYAQALPPSGMLSSRMRAMRRHLAGIDSRALAALIRDIRQASLSDQAEAAQIIDRILCGAPFCAAGNRRLLQECRSLFDEIMDLRAR